MEMAGISSMLDLTPLDPAKLDFATNLLAFGAHYRAISRFQEIFRQFRVHLIYPRNTAAHVHQPQFAGAN